MKGGRIAVIEHNTTDELGVAIKSSRLEKVMTRAECIYYSKNHHSDIIKITHPQNEDRLNSRFVLGVGDFSIIL
ncbi:MAG: hypothetical protein LBK41_09300, partial [Clostridiales bacterium]|nr:hypothetical protein [Clostridiales bacterium]